jgi:hypothetical protein
MKNAIIISSLLFFVFQMASFSQDNNQDSGVFRIAFRVDEIIANKGFISRKQERSSYFRGGPMKKKINRESVFVAVTNTATLVNGKWIDGEQKDFKAAGVMTNGAEQLQVIIPLSPVK